MKPTSVYISNLTPLRGFAALMVVIFHFEEIIGRFVNASDSMFIRKSYLMVDLFFVMSGFIIFHVYNNDFKKSIDRYSFSKFLVARFARIYPLHFFMLLICVLIIFLAGVNQVFNPAAIPTHILLLQSFGIHKIFTLDVPSWSISAEWWSYILFPLIVFCINKRKWLTVACCSIFIVAAYLSIMYLLPRTNPFNPSVPVAHDLNTTFDYGFLRGLAGFITGIVLYIFYQSYHIKNIFKKDILSLVCCIAVIAAMHFGINDGLHIPLFALLILAFASNNGYVTKLCNNRVLQYLGDISYSIYMTQLIILFFVPKIIEASGITIPKIADKTFAFSTGILYCLFILTLAIAFSLLTYHNIEVPLRKWINKKWSQRKYISYYVDDSIRKAS
jgi:peptidoglycan/LPS O-acetylase OafA/YrhL